MPDLSTTFAGGIQSPNPFWLASAPPTNCGEQIMRAFDAGWGGAVWKTLGDPIVNVSSRYGGLDLGNAKLMADLAIIFGDLDRRADELRSDGATALFIAIDHKPGGVIAIADPIKATTQAALDTLRNDGVRIVILRPAGTG